MTSFSDPSSFAPGSPGNVARGGSTEVSENACAVLASRLDALATVAWIVPDGSPGASHVSGSYRSLWGRDETRLSNDALEWIEAVLPEHRAQARAAMAAADGAEVLIAIACRTGVLWARVRATRFPGDPGFVLVQCTDVSDLYWKFQHVEVERARLHRELALRDTALNQAARRLGQESATREEAERLLLHAERLELLGRLTPGIAHDFNNVLAIVSGTLHLIQASSGDERQRGLVVRASQAISSASALVKSLHEFAGEGSSGVQPVDVNRAITDVGQLLRQAAGASITIELKLHATGWVLADPHQLRMALLNLVINARDAMPDGGRLTIATADGDGLQEGAFLDVSVGDTGSGMTLEQLARAREPFFTTKSPGRGTGLGLPMVDAFVQAAGGQLILDSEPNVGTIATLRLARIEPGRPELEPLQPQPIDRRRHGNAVVLVVEDDPLLLPVTAACVRDLGYDVVEAKDAVGALATADRTPELALLITDIELPDLDGVALADRLRATHPDLGVVFVTAHTERARAGTLHCVPKPFDPATLAASILSALGRDSQPQADDAFDRFIAHPALRDLHARWAAEQRMGILPSVDAMHDTLARYRDIAVVAHVVPDDPGHCAFDHIGEALMKTYSSTPGAEEQVVASVEAAYVECATSGRPSYESIRYRLGAEPAVQFERVIVPCRGPGAATITHLIGLVSFVNMRPM